jgi:hypothetical protein
VTQSTRKHVRVTHPPRECPVCHDLFVPTRSHQEVCSATCRKRRARGTYVVTAEDRAAIVKVRDLVPIPGLPRDPPTPEEIRAHVLATAVRT